ncbi:MAG: DNA integrity scanning diadenylate cyclase DisA [Acidimicrobiia bacterium]|nr:DNA integrity scanning diadenylate cyclase DisA [Acidimicrobiia bacterium]MDH3397839.1 DNA integrity scanning diadenylate cyclase DisA [Acidimicrobiia bacterium]
MASTSPGLLEILQRLAPGTPLREALARIIQHRNGALIVLGYGPEVDSLCTGGFELTDSDFSPARLAELAKMDGAIVLDSQWQKILRVNVHLLPDPAVTTQETGARYRTAERVARQTGRPVVAVSEDRRVATLFLGGEKHELQSPTALAAEVNQELLTLERFRRRLDEAEERLTREEVADLMTFRAVVQVVQRAELVRRIGQDIEKDSIGLGGEGGIISLQLADLLYGTTDLRDLVIRDYVRPVTAKRLNESLAELEALPTADLSDPDVVAAALGFDHPDSHTRPLGARLLSQVPRLPAPVRDEIVKHFKDFQKMLRASVDELDEVAGVGRTRALQLRLLFDRMLETIRAWDHSVDL